MELENGKQLSLPCMNVVGSPKQGQICILDLASNDDASAEKLHSPLLPMTNLEKGVIGWESQQDPEMPLNYSRYRKRLLVTLLAMIRFSFSFTLGALSPALDALNRHYRNSDITKGDMPMSIFILGFAVGPLFLSPLSDAYGRKPVLIGSSAFSCLSLVGCALAPSLDLLILFRFLCGLGASGSNVTGNILAKDLFVPSGRGRVMSMLMLTKICGFTAGSMLGASIVQHLGWRWVNWVSLIMSTAALIAMGLFTCETNARVLIHRKTAKLRRKLDRPELQSCYPPQRAAQVSNLVHPFKILVKSPIIFSSSLYYAIASSCQVLLFNSIPRIFQHTYHWSLGTTGLVYLSFFAGELLGIGVVYRVCHRSVARRTAANNHVYEPEFCLAGCVLFSFAVSFTLFIYGWSADKDVYWLIPVLGIVPFGFGLAGLGTNLHTYSMEAYPDYAAPSITAFNILRNTVGAFLPCAGPVLYRNLGIGWTSSVFGFTFVALAPVLLVMKIHGKWLRTKFPIDL